MQDYLVRSYSPVGLYPVDSFFHKNAMLFISNEIIFSIVKIERKIHFTEDTLWLLPEEIQLCSAINLSVPPMNFGKTIFYPNMPGYTLELERNSLNNKNLENIVMPFIKKKMNTRKDFPFDYTVLPQFISNMDYQFNYKAKNKKRQLQLFNAINLENKMLIRGLDTLLKSNVLFRHPQFLVEACSLLHISMEVSFHLVCDKANINHLKQKSKVKKAQEYLCTALDERYEGQKYFEPFYEDRIKIVHPKNNFGIFAQPPISLDDFYQLYDNLIAVYSFLLIGYKKLMWESNWDY